MITRFIIWEEALKLYIERPILGIGFRSYNQLSSFLRGKFSAFQGQNIHNMYIQLIVETGIIGFFLYLMILVNLAILAFNGIRKVRERKFYPIVFGFSGMVVANAVMGMTDNLLSSPVIQWYIWAAAGLVTCSIIVSKSEEKKNQR
jgi:O-antigen ligase